MNIFKRIKTLWVLSSLGEEIKIINPSIISTHLKNQQATIVEPDPIEELGAVIEKENV